MNDIRYEVMKGNGFCRGCDKLLERGKDWAVKTYSWRGRGQSILLCSSCVTVMYHKMEVDLV
jgi:RNase P subunit RPR2